MLFLGKYKFMKNIVIALIVIFPLFTSAQALEGAWKLVQVNGKPVTDREVIKLYKDDYFAFGAKETDSDRFLAAGGGNFYTEDGYSERYDFFTEDSTLIGQDMRYELSLKGDEIILEDQTSGSSQVWKRISIKQNDLSGNWVITGRERNGELRRSTPGARRTIKLLSGGRFQWAAFNSDTGQFYGTGGGTYSAEDGIYEENIRFFSRDDSRVGAKLQFNYEVKDEEWHHSGKSSKGDPLYEIWSPYKEAYYQK